MKPTPFLRATLFLSGLSLLGTVSFASVPGLQQQIPPAEYAALVDLYTSTDGPNWTINEGWNDPAAPSWFGVTVSGFVYDASTGAILSVGTVTELDIANDPANGHIRNNLKGSIPDSIANLANLEYLDLRFNKLSGPIPETLGSLWNLRLLYLASNSLEGSIPENLGSLLSLEYLDLADNALSGNIPESVGNLVNLRVLSLSGNRLTGSIPESVGNLGDLEVLSIGVNRLSGSIPESLGNLVNLSIVGISDTDIGGSIPESFGNLPNLGYVVLARNHLTGDLPAGFVQLENIGILFLESNCFDVSPGSQARTIIDQLVQKGVPVFYEPQDADCSIVPGFAEQIPPAEYLALVDLYVSAQGTDWRWRGSWTDPAALYWPGVTVSGFEYDHETGQVLTVGNVTAVDLHYHLLGGSLPESIENLTQLRELILNENDLSGNLPESLVNLEHLQLLDIAMNCFDVSSGSQVRTVLHSLAEAGTSVRYNMQQPGCGPLIVGDLNRDGCVDRVDFSLVVSRVFARVQDLTYDLNGDGKVDVADARFLVLHFTNPDGSTCPP